MDLPDAMIQIGAFIDMYAGMAENVFLTRFDSPFFLINVVDVREDDGTGSSVLKPGKSTVLRPTKRPTTTILTLVTVLDTSSGKTRFELGRGKEKDIVVPNGSVSRNHAVIDVDPISGRSTITDVGSSYGTVVNKIPAHPNQPVDLTSGSIIILGQSSNCSLFSPKDFYEYLQGLVRMRGD